MVRDVLRYYLSVAWSLRKYFIPTVILSPLSRVGTDYIAPLIVATVINKISSGERPPIGELVIYVVAFFLIPFLSELVWRVIVWCMNRTDAYGMERIANYAFKDLINRPHDFHANNFAGSLVAKTNRFINAFEGIHDTFVFEVLGGIVGFSFVFTVLFMTSWPVGVAFTLIFIPVSVVLYRMTRTRYGLSVRRSEQESLQTAQLADALSNAVTVKTFAKEAYEQRLFKKITSTLSLRRLLTWDYQNSRIDAVSANTTVVLNAMALAGAVYAIYYFSAPVGTVFLILAYSRTLTAKIWDLSRTMRGLETHISNAVEMMRILKKDHALVDAPGAKPMKIGEGNISIKSVAFSYHTDNKHTLFKKLSLDIPAGQSVGLVGPSGGGKTTITKLLLRFMDIRDGVIEIDGQDVSQVTQDSLREVITYVPQEPLLFHRSLIENIAYGRPGASLKAIIAASTKANAHEFITKLPEGYDTLVGERGIKLSGGQRQRVALARAILKDAPIVVLDEATSALDSESEKLIQEALFSLIQGRTTIIVAHRLSTIKHLDRIIVLEDGKITEDGTHDELIADKNGTYARLWSHQSGGFIE